MRRVAVVMLLAGGVTCLSGVWITQSTPEGARAQGLVAAVFLVSGLALLAVRRPGRVLLESAAFVGISLLSLLIGTTDTLGMAPFFYLWPAVYLAYFSSTRTLVAAGAWMGTTLAAALFLNDVPLGIDVLVGTSSSVGLMAALVHSLTRRQALLRAELAAAAETDPLTGLLNRRSFDRMLALRVADAVERRRSVAVAMFDIDHFKRLNDAHGHLAGDRALVHIAEVLREHSREDDLVARFGGEEFVVVLSGADATAGRTYASRVAAELGAESATTDLPLSISVGISTLTDRREAPSILVQRADEALYAAKEAGRARVATWTGDGAHLVEPLDATPS